MEIPEKIAIINALMQEDRSEIRMTKSIIVNTSFFAVSGIVAITAFAISQLPSSNLSFYLFGTWSFFLLYIATFVYFEVHLKSLRQCLEIRESYYRNFQLLEDETPFYPLKEINKSSKPGYETDYLWFLPVSVLLAALGNTFALCIL